MKIGILSKVLDDHFERAGIGIKDLTIINLDDATLIMPHEKAEEVKNIVEMLKSLNNNKYL